MKKSFLLIILTSLTLLSCSKNEIQGKIYHPQKEYLPEKHLIKTIGEKEVNDSIFEIKKVLIKERDTSFSIGMKSKNQIELFGDITDLDTDSSGNIYILDSKTYSIRKYNSLGELITGYGGKQGKGPGDLFRPMAFEVTDEGIIYVADTFNKITVLKSDDTNIEYLATINTPKIMASDMCRIEDRLFLRAVGVNKDSPDSSNFKMVQSYSLETSKYLDGFGNIYRSGRIGTDLRLSGGMSKIGCISSSKTVVIAYEFFPFLYGYSTKGELKWIIELSPFEQKEIVEVVSDGIDVRWTFRTGGDRIISIQDLKYEDYLLVQVIRNKKDSSPKLLSYIISSKNSNGIFLGDQISWILKKNADYVFLKEVKDGIGVAAMEIK